MTTRKTFTHAGCEIEIWHDDHGYGRSPHDAIGDCLAPALIRSLQRGGFETIHNDDLTDPLAAMDPLTAMQNWRAILEQIGGCEATFLEDWQTACEDHTHPAAYALPETWHKTLQEHVAAYCDHVANDVDVLAWLWNLAGRPAKTFTRNGYTQGDTIQILLVHTESWCKAMGTPEDRTPEDLASDMGSDADMIADWAFGDCYGFTVTDPTGEAEDVTVGGFWGAYMSDGWKYMIEVAKAEAEAMAAPAKVAA